MCCLLAIFRKARKKRPITHLEMEYLGILQLTTEMVAAPMNALPAASVVAADTLVVNTTIEMIENAPSAMTNDHGG